MAPQRHRRRPQNTFNRTTVSTPSAFDRLSSQSQDSRITSSTSFSGLSNSAARIRQAYFSSANGSHSRLTHESAQQAPSTPAQSPFEQDFDDNSDVIMAVDMRDRGTVGCAYYVAEEEKLYIAEDMKCSSIDMIDMLKIVVNPTIVLVSNRADDSVMQCIDPGSQAHGPNETGNNVSRLPYAIELRPGQEFNYEFGKQKLGALQVGSPDRPDVRFIMPGEMNIMRDTGSDDDEPSGARARLLKLSGWISLENRVSVGCVGALIGCLHRRRAATFLPRNPAANATFRIAAIEMTALKDTMFINQDTVSSLQIVQLESHPSSHNQGPTKSVSSSKEGLSVYGLFQHFARTKQGKHLLKQMFLRPSQNLDIIDERLVSVAVFCQPENAAMVSELGQSLRGVANVRKLIVNLQKGVATGFGQGGRIAKSTWLSLQMFAFHALKLQRILSNVTSGTQSNIFKKVYASFDRLGLEAVGRTITHVIDFDETRDSDRTVVREGLDAELDERKRLWAGIDDLLKDLALQLSEEIPTGLPTELNAVCFPQIGFLIVVPLDEESNQALWDGPEDDKWEVMFTTEASAYYKSSAMRGLDNQYGDIWGEICDREIEMLHDLAQRVLEYQEMLVTVSDVCGELDCLLALAAGARQYNLVRPRMTRQNLIDIRGGRHILQALTVPSYVPNDTYLVGGNVVDTEEQKDHPGVHSGASIVLEPSTPEGPTMLMLTGPNYSGKSVYLKQIAVIVYMAHIGSFVPADSALIGITDKILTRIATRETVSQNQSAFMVDLQQVSLGLNLATPRSLLIIDEFGMGTNAADGAGLACGIYEYLLNLGPVKSPKVLAATHFHEIFESGYLRDRPHLHFAHMEIRTFNTVENIKEQIVYLYNLRDGRSNTSFGTHCAAINGISPEIVAKAEQLALLAARGEDLVAVCTEMSKEETEELDFAEQIAREFLSVDIEGNPLQLLDRVLGPPRQPEPNLLG